MISSSNPLTRRNDVDIVAPKEYVMTPWDVKGEIDYEKLIQQFGTKQISQKLLNRIQSHAGKLHMHLRRGIFFSHRDLDSILDEYEKGNDFVLYTGRGPSGPVHLGHLVPWLFTKHLQDVFGAKLYFQFTDDERLLIRPEFSEKDTNYWVYENALDVLALGFDPEKIEFIVNLRHTSKIYPLALKIARKITASTAKGIFGFNESSLQGLMFFPAMQAVPCFLESERKGRNVPCLIPAGIDQDTYWRMTRDVASKLGYPKPAQIHGRILPGLTGTAKMSSSQPDTAIYTTDDPKQIEQKIMAAYTGKNQGSKHNPASCSVYSYFFFLFEESDENMRLLENECLKGNRDCIECKRALITLISDFLNNFQRKRRDSEKIVDNMIQ